ncbi:MAG: hypothetical protein ACLFTH_04035 [Candidatus Woesearchaeota archaeon]
MQVKHNHNCQLCSNQKTCFVFKDYAMLFSLCRECFDQLVRDHPTYRQNQDFCSFCEKERNVSLIEGFPDSLFFTDVKICDECFTKMKATVSENNGENE